jgi:ribose 5-phosphate isomerase B
MMITMVIGADHHGFAYKEYIKQQLTMLSQPIAWYDVGARSDEHSDYPLFAHQVAHAIVHGKAEFGVLLCGTGVGMAIAANRHKGIYAALAWNEEVAQLSRQHDHANVLVLPADYISADQAVAMIRVWLQAEPLSDEHKRRVAMIDCL